MDEIENLSKFTSQESIRLVKRIFSENTDADVATTTIRATLTCPLGKALIETPCRSTSCTHIQCFDGIIFFGLNTSKDESTWRCPVCNGPIRLSSIKIDQLWDLILMGVPKDCEEVEFRNNGSWNFVQNKPEVSDLNNCVEVLEILSLGDSDDECSNGSDILTGSSDYNDIVYLRTVPATSKSTSNKSTRSCSPERRESSSSCVLL